MSLGKAPRQLVIAGIALLAGAALAACGGSSTTTVTATPTAAAPTVATQAPTTQAASPTTTSSGGGAAQPKRIAVYHPSTVIKQNNFALVLRSPDPVSKVGAFYKAQLAQGGWQIRSASSNAFHANFTARRDGEGVTIAVYPTGSGSGVTVAEHPQ